MSCVKQTPGNHTGASPTLAYLARLPPFRCRSRRSRGASAGPAGCKPLLWACAGADAWL